MSRKEAAMFPIISSVTLVSLYILYKVIERCADNRVLKLQMLLKMILPAGVCKGICQLDIGRIFLLPWHSSFVSSNEVNCELLYSE